MGNSKAFPVAFLVPSLSSGNLPHFFVSSWHCSISTCRWLSSRRSGRPLFTFSARPYILDPGAKAVILQVGTVF